MLNQTWQLVTVIGFAGGVRQAGNQTGFRVHAGVLLVAEEVLWNLLLVALLVANLALVLHAPLGSRIPPWLAFLVAMVILLGIDVGNDMDAIHDLYRAEHHTF